MLEERLWYNGDIERKRGIRMYKIRKVDFHEHPVLGNLSLDFCDSEGNAIDTIIFAGENGTGKSTIINALYMLVSRTADFEADVIYEKDGTPFLMTYKRKVFDDGTTYLYASDGSGLNAWIQSNDVKNRHPTVGIYSDVDINFHSQDLASVTSLSLDERKDSRRSSNDLPTQINQLLIDIQALDDADIAFAIRQHPDLTGKDLEVSERMPRFTRAFNNMFENLTYSRICNQNGKKVIYFSKNGTDIPIEFLSSGEKQIVYRGCFLLKDVDAMNGAFVFIDEPEISLHPNWQMKVMDYYKNIFTDESGVQTSQIFVVTHSPFVIHNENRKNDKVIVLSRTSENGIVVKDRPEYFKCTSIEAVQDAFSVQQFSMDKPTVYLEGRTDEKYFNKAVEAYRLNIPFQFKWIGYMKDEKTEENTGKDALNKAAQFLIARNLPTKNVCLFDCDTHRSEEEKNNVYTRVIPTYNNTKRMKKGIENALILDEIDVNPYYSQKIKEGDYGDNNTIVEFKKMEFCEYICSLDVDIQQIVFSNLRTVIESLSSIFEPI